MADDGCSRSLPATIVAAFSSLALFIGANWGFAAYVDVSLIPRVTLHAVFCMMPWLPMDKSLMLVLEAWKMKRILKKERKEQKRVQGGASSATPWNSRAIAIMTTCPVYIQMPPRFNRVTDTGEIIDVKRLEDMCPLELFPHLTADEWKTVMYQTPGAGGSSGGGGSAKGRGAGAGAGAGAKAASSNNKNHMMMNAHNFKDSQAAGWTMPLAAQSAAAAAREADGLVAQPPQFLRLDLPGKEALLSLGLSPKYEQLSFLRSKSGFEALITMAQAGGYILSLMQRVEQRLGVSPLEAIAAFSSIVMIVQLVLQHFACVHYRQPLLLHLSKEQLEQWHCTPKKPLSVFKVEGSGVGTVRVLVHAVAFLVMLVPTVYYGSHFLLSSTKCVHCSLSAVVFLLSLVTSLTFFYISKPTVKSLLLFVSVTLYVASLVLAVITTIEKWDRFEEQSSSGFDWILPHVST